MENKLGQLIRLADTCSQKIQEITVEICRFQMIIDRKMEQSITFVFICHFKMH